MCSLSPARHITGRGREALSSHSPGISPLPSLGFSARLAALDVGICCPAAAGAGSNCVESMKQRKAARMQPHEGALEDIGVEYRPITFSCFGHVFSPSMVCNSFPVQAAEMYLEERFAVDEAQPFIGEPSG